jgi:hypothetical protein
LLRVTIAEVSVWNVGPILQGLARSILSRSIAAVCGLGDTFDDVYDTADGMPVRRSDTTGRIGHLNHGEFPIIAAGQWKTFENLARDTLKPGFLIAGLFVCALTHGMFFLV